MRTSRTGIYKQGANYQGSRRLLMVTVRESLKLMKNLKNQAKIKLTFDPEGHSGYPEDSEIYKSGEKGNQRKWPQKIQKPKRQKG
jgi:hypothetical protein